MVRKKIDNRIRVLIENGVKLGHRTLFAIVGDKGRDQVCTKLKQNCSHKSTSGRDSPPHARQSRSQSTSLGPVVLQERTGLQQPPQETHETPPAQNSSRQTQRQRRRPLRAFPLLNQNPLLLLLRNTQDLRKHVRHVRAPRF